MIHVVACASANINSNSERPSIGLRLKEAAYHTGKLRQPMTTIKSLIPFS